MRPRLLALAIDLGFLIIPYIALALVAYLTHPWVPQDELGRTTPRARLVLTVASITAFLVYLWIGEVFGGSVGKRAIGIHVVRASTWRSPGAIRGLLRLAAKALTIATLGLGYAVLLLDPERRTVHDWVAGTRVIERI
jgi:uncharacterized RDD family membrane protein YckC